MSHAFQCIDKLDLKSLQDLWTSIESRLLSHVTVSAASTPTVHAATARRLYADLLRCYLVTCVQKVRFDVFDLC